VTVGWLSIGLVVAPLWVLSVADKNAETLTLTNGDDGKSFNLSLGDKVQVELPAASGTGFTWVCTQQPAPLLKDEGMRRVQVDRSLGGQQKQIHTFSTDSAGKVEIMCRLVRPWERNSEPAETVKIELQVGTD
jgi:predicted secreted protein